MDAYTAICICFGITVAGILLYKALDENRDVKVTTPYGAVEIN